MIATLLLLAQVTITPSAANAVTDRSARVNATLSGSAVVYAQFGPTTSYGSRSAPSQGDADNVVVVMTGLTPGAVNNYRLCQTGHTPPTGCTSNQTLNTLAEQQQLPTAPTVPSTAYPSSFTTTYNVASDCSDLQTHINTASAQEGNNDYLVSIPAGTVCTGLVLFPAKTGSNPTGTGTIVVATAGTITPVGSRLTTAYAANLATIVQNTIPDSSGTSNPGTCTPRTYFWRTDSTMMQVCNATNTWTALSATAGYTSGTATPTGACTAGRYYYETDRSDQGTWYCHTSGKWINLLRAGDGRYAVAIPDRYSASAVHGYRMVGIKFENADEQFKAGNMMVAVESGANRVLLDRCYFATQAAAAHGSAVYLNGVNVGVIDSYIDMISQGSGVGGQSINVEAGAGPFLIRNNYFRTTGGIAIFVNDNNSTVPRSDISISGNTIAFSPKANPVSPSYDGLGNRDTRALIEMKRGTRVAIVGNIFRDYYTYALTGGVALLMTARASGSTGGDDNSYLMSDIDIRYNTFRDGTGGIEIWGKDDQGYRNTKMTTRVRINDNLAYSLDGANSANGPVRGHWLYIQDGVEHLTMVGNTLIDMKGTGPAFLNLAGGPVASADIRNNIWWLNHGAAGGGDNGGGIRWSDPTFSTLCDGTTTASSASAQTKLDKCFIAGTTAQYVFRANPVVGGTSGDKATYESTYPTGNYWPGDTTSGVAALGFRDSSNSNYALKMSSTYGPLGSGADMDALRAAQGVLYNLRFLSITSTTANVHYTAPDTSACTVEYGASATEGTGSRTTDTPAGSRFRTVSLSGLTGATTYYVRVYCAQLVSSSFTTI